MSDQSTKQMREAKTKEEIREDSMQFLSFFVQNELFALDIQRIKEIIEYSGVTRIPMMKNFIRGVINLRGNVVPVVSLADRFEREKSGISRKTSIIVVEVLYEDSLINVGMLVDEVDEVVEIPLSRIEPAPDFGSKIRSGFLYGVGKLNNKFIMLLNVDSVLNVEELAVIAGTEKKTRLQESS